MILELHSADDESNDDVGFFQYAFLPPIFASNCEIRYGCNCQEKSGKMDHDKRGPKILSLFHFNRLFIHFDSCLGIQE